jgi:uncharacterized protein
VIVAVLSTHPASVWVLLLGTGVLIGLLAGLLGIGGGMIAVPGSARSLHVSRHR